MAHNRIPPVMHDSSGREKLEDSIPNANFLQPCQYQWFSMWSTKMLLIPSSEYMSHYTREQFSSGGKFPK